MGSGHGHGLRRWASQRGAEKVRSSDFGGGLSRSQPCANVCMRGLCMYVWGHLSRSQPCANVCMRGLCMYVWGHLSRSQPCASVCMRGLCMYVWGHLSRSQPCAGSRRAVEDSVVLHPRPQALPPSLAPKAYSQTHPSPATCAGVHCGASGRAARSCTTCAVGTCRSRRGRLCPDGLEVGR